MTSECTVFASGDPVTDPVTFEVTYPKTTVWFGPCKVRPAGTQNNDIEVGQAERGEYDFVVSVPFSVANVVRGHRLTITSSPDLALAGRTLEVQAVAAGDFISARRLACTEVT